MSEWQPMETAPRDGTQILAVLAYNTPAVSIIAWPDYKGARQMWRRETKFGRQISVPVLCWMPLPAPPTEAGER